MAIKLLLAEDSLTIQKVFELTFKQSGISLTMVDNGLDAVRLAAEIAPDLVVADVSLPGKSGYEVAADLRNSEKTRSCPILILAGTLVPLDEERFRRCGANDVLFKPFESQELLDKVENMLAGAEEPAPTAGQEVPAAPADEPWDFSDVMTEVDEAGKRPASAAEGGDDLTAAAAAHTAEGTISLGDFDVSLEDLEDSAPEPGVGAAEAAAAEATGVAEPSGKKDVERHLPEHHMELPQFDDSPPPVTDLAPALEEFEELEELEHLEETDLREAEPAVPVPQEEPVVSLPIAPQEIEAPGPPPEASAAEPETPPPSMEGELRELFSGRAQEIFEKVAAEAVEKVMWEMMEGLSKEFSARIRESVEAVAWEVVPATTEALVREEIARIREQAGKKTS